MLRWALPAAVCLTLATGPALADVTVTPAGNGYDIDITGQASASELLDAINATTGAGIIGQPEDTTVNANQLRGTSIERALRKLLPGAAFAVRYSDDGKPSAIIFLSPDKAGADNEDMPVDGMQGGEVPTATDGMAPDDGVPDSSDSGDDVNQPAQ